MTQMELVNALMVQLTKGKKKTNELLIYCLMQFGPFDEIH